MDFLSNEFIVENLSKILGAGVLAFIISFLLTPLVAKLAERIGAVDLPAHMRGIADRTKQRRIHSEPKPKLAGLALAISFLVVIFLTGSYQALNFGILLGLLIIIVLGVLDDKYELSGAVQLFFMELAAFSVIVIGGISVTSITFLGAKINFDMYSALITLGDFSYNFIFPADILTAIWIIAIINFVNWMSGVDGVNGLLSSIAGFAIMLLALQTSNVGLAMVIAIFIGANLGWLPFNLSPAKIFPGMAEHVNGFLLAVFAILAGTRWSVTLLLLGVPIIDALLVLFLRFRAHPEVRRRPWKLLRISDTNHLHHRLLDAGYSKGNVLLIEATIMIILAAIALFFGFEESRPNFAAFVIGIAFIILAFTAINVMQARRKRKLSENYPLPTDDKKPKKAKVQVVVGEQKEDDYERYVY